LAEYLIQHLSLCPWLAYTVAGVVHVVLLLTIALAAAAVSIWLERKVSARIQDRLGPTRVGGRFGWLQPPADGLKLLGKEDIIPAAADSLLFRAAPYISYCAAFCVFLAIPFANGWVALRLDSAAFFFLAIAGLEIFGVILAGYASGSKYSLYGSMREAAQVISYEIPMGLCVVVPVMIAGTMDLTAIGQQQAGWFTNWYLFHDPFTFVTFWIYVTCAIAHVNRAPFDLPEAESELVAGFMTEYSGFRWVVFFMAEYAAMFAVSGLAAVLFLGGWNGPLPVTEWLGLSNGAYPLLNYLGNLLGMCNFIFKCFAGVTCMIWIRWTLPRLRIDQVMTMCLKYCIPLVAAMFVGAMLWLYLFPDGVFLKTSPSVAMAGSNEELQIENCRLQIENCRRQTGDVEQLSIRSPQLTICSLQLPICNLQFPVCNAPCPQGAP
jgi:NADH-quinone oxidoreductase subunit H